MDSGFGVVAAHPIKAEMSGATPKSQAKEPIDLDIILVCRKLGVGARTPNPVDLWLQVKTVASHQVARLRDSGRKLSRNDIRIIVMAQLLRMLSTTPTVDVAMAKLTGMQGEIQDVIATLAQEEERHHD
jgi:putative DNA methylase